MIIVPFDKNDQDEARRFMETIYLEMGWSPKPSNGFNDLEKFFHLPKDGFLLLIKENDQIIGTGGCVLLNSKEAVLKRFYIDKNHRGKGLAQQFLEKIIEKAKEFRLSRIVIDVSKNNKRAIRFYEKCGFAKYEAIPTEKWSESKHPDNYNYYFLKI